MIFGVGRNYSEFLGLKYSQERLQNAGKMHKNHKKCAEPGPYGSVWADICAKWLPQAPGTPWNCSGPLKPTKIKKIRDFWILGGFRGPEGFQGVPGACGSHSAQISAQMEPYGPVSAHV